MKKALKPNKSILRKQSPANEDSQTKYRYMSGAVGDSFAFIRCEIDSGKVWSHNESDQWGLLTKDETINSGDYACVVAPYSIAGGKSPLSAGVTSTTETWALFRIDQRTGLTWTYENGAFEERVSEKSDVATGEYRLICERVGGHFAIYKYDVPTGTIWRYTDGEWKLIETEALPVAQVRLQDCRYGARFEPSSLSLQLYDWQNMGQDCGRVCSCGDVKLRVFCLVG